METVKVNLKKRSYDVVIADNSLDSLGRLIRRLNPGSDAYIITNPKVKTLYGKGLARVLEKEKILYKFSLIPDREESKSLDMAHSILNDLAGYDIQKRIFIIALGGGVTGDLSGFVASIYKRGIPYIQIPTTLLAQVDSSIGGKTGVDLNQGKNLAGTFYQPKLVFSDVSLLKTLDSRQIRNGLAEVIKYGVIKDGVLFNFLEKKFSLPLNENNISGHDFRFIVARCSRIKAKIVQQDERETLGIRTILNFGHTIGHAIETAGNYRKYSHGEAVALGMLTAIDISVMMKLLPLNEAKRIGDLIKSAGLPSKIKDISPRSVIKAHYSDKKFSGPKNKFVLLESIGKTKIVDSVPFDKIKAALMNRF